LSPFSPQIFDIKVVSDEKKRRRRRQKLTKITKKNKKTKKTKKEFTQQSGTFYLRTL